MLFFFFNIFLTWVTNFETIFFHMFIQKQKKFRHNQFWKHQNSYTNLQRIQFFNFSKILNIELYIKFYRNKKNITFVTSAIYSFNREWFFVRMFFRCVGRFFTLTIVVNENFEGFYKEFYLYYKNNKCIPLLSVHSLNFQPIFEHCFSFHLFLL